MTSPDITIPPEAIEAHAMAYLTHDSWGQRSWSDLSDAEREERLEGSEVALQAMIKAWPGMWHRDWTTVEVPKPCLILPLPQESTNG